MFNIIFLCVFLLTVLSILHVGYGDKMGGKGKFIVHYTKTCSDDFRYENKIDPSKKKMNRTHDGYDVKFKLVDVIDKFIGIRIDVCKFVDGGDCKPYQVLADDSAERFIKKYAKDNLRRALKMMGVDPADFPIPPGEYVITGYDMDQCELPSDGIYGSYEVYVYFIKNSMEIACVVIRLDFTKFDDEWCGEEAE